MPKTFAGTLKLTIVDAKDITEEKFGRKDAYCNVSLGSAGLGGILSGEGIGKERFKTKVHEGDGSNPYWNESHLFDLQGMKPEVRLKISLYDQDLFKDDYLGLVEITLAELLKNRDTTHYYELKNQDRLVGRIGLNVKFNCQQIPDTLHEDGMVLGTGAPIEQPPVGTSSAPVASGKDAKKPGIVETIKEKVKETFQGKDQPQDQLQELHHQKEKRDLLPASERSDDTKSQAQPTDKQELPHYRHHLAGDLDKAEKGSTTQELPHYHLAGDIDKIGRQQDQGSTTQEVPHYRHHLAGDIDKVGRQPQDQGSTTQTELPHYRHHLAGDIDKIGRQPNTDKTDNQQSTQQGQTEQSQVLGH